MPPQPAVPQGKTLIEKARTLGVPIDDLLTADGEEIAWKADRDFNAPINGVLVEFQRGDPIRERNLITALRSRRCPVTSVESELWQRVTTAQAVQPAPAPLIDSFTILGVRISVPEALRRGRLLLQRGLAWLQRQLGRSS